MIKDLSASLIAAAAEINKKSREQFHAEQAAMDAKKKTKMPMQPAPKAEPAAVSGAGAKMAEEAGGTTPKTPKEKKLAALAGNKKLITHADVMTGRGVKKEEAEAQQEGWDDMMKASKEGKGTGKFDKKEIKPGVTQYTRKSSTFDDGPGKDADERKIDRQKRKGMSEGLMATLKKIGKKAIDTIGHGSDEDMRKDLQKKMGLPQTGKKPTQEEVEHLDEVGNTPQGQALLAKVKSRAEKRAHDSRSATDTDYAFKQRAAHVRSSTRMGEEVEQVGENMDTPGNSTHQCAIHVKSEQFGEGRCLTGQHAEPDAQGLIEWYDVMFNEGIQRVNTKDVEVLVTENHMNHKKKKAK